MADNFDMHEWNLNRLIEENMGDADLKAKKRVDIITKGISKQFPDLDQLRLKLAVSTALTDLALQGLSESDDPAIGDELEAGVIGDKVEESSFRKYEELEKSLRSELESLISKPRVSMGVYNATGEGFGTVSFIQKEDIDVPTFEKLMAAIESEGYKVIPSQSNRFYDEEVGERSFFPKIKFSWDPQDVNEQDKEGISAEKEDEFHRELDKLVHKTFGHSSDEKKKMEEAKITKSINDKISKEVFAKLKGKTVRYGGTRYTVKDADGYTLKLSPTEPGDRGLSVNLNQFNKSGIIQEMIKAIYSKKQ